MNANNKFRGLSILLILPWICFCQVFAEVVISLPIVELVSNSEKIVQAKFLLQDNDIHVFLSKDIHSQSGFNDTLRIRLNIDTLDDGNLPYNQWYNDLKSADEIIIFISEFTDSISVPFYSGFRFFISDTFTSYPPNTHLSNNFYEPASTKAQWDEFINRIINIKSRVDSVFRLNQLTTPKKRNKALFKWLEENKNEFNIRCLPNEDCGWGFLHFTVLEWIVEREIIQDTWRASQVYREIQCKGETNYEDCASIYGISEDSTFLSMGGIEFLLDKSLNKNLSIIERRQALAFLSNAVRFIYFRNNSIITNFSDTEYQAKKQSELLDLVMPLMYDEELEFYAFRVISKLSNPMDGNLSHRINLKKLPELVLIYQKLQFKPSKLRDDLSYFLAFNSTREEWKEISSNDQRILMNLYHVYYDTLNQRINFNINYNFGTGKIHSIPKVKFEKIENGNITDFKILNIENNLHLPLENWRGATEIKVEISNLANGTWRFHAFGSAGDVGQYSWGSEGGTFEKQ